MKKNMGMADRMIRLIIATSIAVLYFTGAFAGTWGLVLLAVSGVLLFTSLVGFCPLYAPFHFSTQKD
jgi:hypothetical protein